MKFELDQIEILKISLTVIGGVFLLWQYYNQLTLSKAKVLDGLWNKFSSDVSMARIFSLMDSCELNSEDNPDIEILRSINESDKIRYLAHLSELLIFINTKKISPKLVDEKKLIQLYKCHFYYIFISGKTQVHFWSNLISISTENHQEIIQNIRAQIGKYWSKHLTFAQRCKSYLEDQKNIS
jgi:hypothetical protein